AAAGGAGRSGGRVVPAALAAEAVAARARDRLCRLRVRQLLDTRDVDGDRRGGDVRARLRLRIRAHQHRMGAGTGRRRGARWAAGRGARRRRAVPLPLGPLPANPGGDLRLRELGRAARGRAVERLDRAHLAERVGAAEERLRVAAHGGAEVLDLQEVAVDVLDLDPLVVEL